MATATKPRAKAPEETHDYNDEDARHIYEQAKAIFEPEGVYTGPDGQPLPLAARLAKIISVLPEVKPEGVNQHFKYSFVTDKQVLGLVRPRLAEQRILIIPDTVTEQEPIQQETARGGRSMLTRLHVVFRVLDGLNGESFTGEAIGYGDDSGDKGANKAYTAALKNFLIKLFLMGGADRDIEDDPETDKRATARERAVAPVTSVEVKETVVESVARGGRSSTATEAQIQAVSRLVAELGLDPQRLAGAIEIILEDPDVDFSNWIQVKEYLSKLSGESIGKIIESLSEDAEGRQAVDGGY